ncbi:hypothetical protein JZ751_006093 [Albula glossodonta]|uniref:Uncharacterized protein n=1 Tax=Albula glossodonta TaxID=121402 RepID=A0A8T2P684_9TELE|nr:hypothetical protein JZ751_006093 [Albula glossodonta]
MLPAPHTAANPCILLLQDRTPSPSPIPLNVHHPLLPHLASPFTQPLLCCEQGWPPVSIHAAYHSNQRKARCRQANWLICARKEKYQREQEKLKQEWEKAQKEVEEEERKYHEEERKILEETVAPLTPRSSALPSPSRVDIPLPTGSWGTIRGSEGDQMDKQDHIGWSDGFIQQSPAASMDCRVTQSSHLQSSGQTEAIAQSQQNGQRSPSAPQLQFQIAPSWNNRQTKQQEEEEWRKTASLDRNWNSAQTPPGGMKRAGSYENVGTNPSQSSSSCSSDAQPPSPNRGRHDHRDPEPLLPHPVFQAAGQPTTL